MTTIKIGLNRSKKDAIGASKPAPAKRKPPAVFGDDEDEEEEDNLLSKAKSPITSSVTSKTKSNDFQEITTFDEDVVPAEPEIDKQPSSPRPSSTKPTLNPKLPSGQHTDASPNLSTLRSQKQQTADIDPSLYDYDAAYDALHSRDKRGKGTGATGKSGAQDQSHMSDLLAAAELRKRDQLRAKDRLLQKEREAEGEAFADKDSFVTEAYKAQQEQVKQAEEAERLREEKEDQRRRQGLGMTGFYKSFMDQEEKRHQEQVDAAANASKDPLANADDAAPREKSDLELAAELRTQGKDVRLNEEGQLIDKRDLLGAGLNVAPKPKSTTAAQSTDPHDAPSQDRSRPTAQQQPGRHEARQAMRERQSRMMEAQLEAAAKRAAEDDAAEREKIERAAKSQKTGAEISSAKERYLARKREAQEAAAKKGA